MIASELECKCTAKVLTVRTFRNGSQHYVYQCIACGATDNALKKIEAERLIATGEKLEAYDENAAERYRETLRTINDQSRSDLKAQRLQEYNTYLQSPEWQSKRQKVIFRASGLCEGCRQKKITQVHHLTYSHVGKELLFQLVGLCDDCHTIAHEGDYA